MSPLLPLATGSPDHVTQLIAILLFASLCLTPSCGATEQPVDLYAQDGDLYIETPFNGSVFVNGERFWAPSKGCGTPGVTPTRRCPGFPACSGTIYPSSNEVLNAPWSGATHIFGDVIIQITSVESLPRALENLTYIGGSLKFDSHLGFLKNIDALSNLEVIGGDLVVERTAALKNIDGLGALHTVGGILQILNNNALTDIDGLASLKYVGGVIDIQHNTLLANLDGLAQLTTSENYILVTNNINLRSVSGLSGIQNFNGPFLRICDNNNLDIIPQAVRDVGSKSTHSENQQCPAGAGCNC